MKNNNSMHPVDVGCGRLIPQGNLDPSQPGSFGGMMKSIGSNKKDFVASTNYGFTPGFTIFGKNIPWNTATFEK